MRFLAGAIALVLLAPPAVAGTPYTKRLTCPIGGKKFNHVATASYTTWGARPDGKPYGSWEFPIGIPKCPDNGLVLFDEFSKEDLARLKPLIATPEYLAMSSSETDYYLAAWLMTQLGRPRLNAAWLLVQASWEADGDPTRKARYQSAYVDAIRALPREEEDGDWLIMQGRAANGLRELGRFDEATALISSLSLAPLDVVIPVEQYGEATPSGLGKQVINYDEIREAKRRRGFLDYFKQLDALIQRRDTSSEPLRFIPARMAAYRCKEEWAVLSADDREYCATSKAAEAMSGKGD